MIILGIIFFLCIVFGAFFEGAEMAFVSSNRLKLRELADSGSRAAQIILRLHERPHHFMTTLLVANNIVMVGATTLFTLWLQLKFNIQSEWFVTAVLAPFLLIFTQMVPKDYCRLRSHTFLLQYAGLLHLLSRAFHLLTSTILAAVNFFLAPLGSSKPKSIFVDEEEFRSVIEESVKSGVLGPHEKKLIETVLDFERIHVDAVMIPVEKVPKVDITTAKVGDVKSLARETQQKMILVTEELPTLVVGMIYVFDLLFEADETKGLKDYLRSPIFLSKNTSIERAFLTLQHKRQSNAVITDESGEVIGAVPIERLLVL